MTVKAVSTSTSKGDKSVESALWCMFQLSDDACGEPNSDAISLDGEVLVWNRGEICFQSITHVALQRVAAVSWYRCASNIHLELLIFEN